MAGMPWIAPSLDGVRSVGYHAAMSSPTRRLLACLLTVPAIALSACGDDSDGPGHGPEVAKPDRGARNAQAIEDACGGALHVRTIVPVAEDDGTQSGATTEVIVQCSKPARIVTVAIEPPDPY